MLILAEAGALSLRNQAIPCIEAYTDADMEDVWKWCKESAEARKYATLIFDSGSHIAELALKKELTRTSHGLKAYGAMSTRVAAHMEWANFVQGPNVVIICKQDNKPEDGTGRARPYWPGRDLHIQIPHLFDEILHLEDISGSDGQIYKCFRTYNDATCIARDRSGALASIEPANLKHIFDKIGAS